MQAAIEKQDLEPCCWKTRLTLGSTPSTKRFRKAVDQHPVCSPSPAQVGGRTPF